MVFLAYDTHLFTFPNRNYYWDFFFFFLLKCVYISGGIVKIVFWNSVVRQKEILLTTDVADISRFSWSYQHTAGLEEQEIQHYFVCAISNRKKRDRHEIVRITKILLTLLSADAFSEETQQQMQKAGRNARNSQATSPVAHCHTYAHHLLLSAACGSSDNTYWVNACRVCYVNCFHFSDQWFFFRTCLFQEPLLIRWVIINNDTTVKINVLQI